LFAAHTLVGIAEYAARALKAHGLTHLRGPTSLPGVRRACTEGMGHYPLCAIRHHCRVAIAGQP